MYALLYRRWHKGILKYIKSAIFLTALGWMRRGKCN